MTDLLARTDPAMTFAIGYAGLLAGMAILSLLRGRPGQRSLKLADGIVRATVPGQTTN
jgi:hypothetical protein